MQLKSLELVGFKSFPDKTVISFSPGITAIVGPNGSGKSNIADALRWVMGETSSRSLRGVKMEDVIFDGTQSRKPLGLAEVSLTLDNSDSALPTNYSEVVITRRFYRSGESEYLINRQNVRLKDIHDLFLDTGLGKTGYSIISQGSVTEIISARSTERRYVFEEAAGIAKFKYKKEESEKKLAATQENLVRLTDIASELAERLGPLEQQAKKARKYIELFDEKKKLEIALWLDDLVRFKQELSEAEKEAESLRISSAENENEIIRCEDEIEKLSNDIADITAKIEDIRAENRRFDEILQEKNAEILIISNNIEHENKDIERLNAEIAEAEKDDSETEKEKAEKLAEKERLSGDISRIFEEEKTIRAEREDRIGNDSEYAVRSEELRKEFGELNAEITSLEVEKGRAEQYLSSLDERSENEKKELEDALERKKSIKKSNELNGKNRSELEQKLEENKNIQSGYAFKVSSAKKKLERANEAYNALKLSLSDTQNRKTMLEDMEKHYEGFAGSVKSVMNEASRGILKGVCGTVASVIKTEDHFAVAAEIALGAAIQNIITEDERSAKDCIYFLKSRNLGRATFQPVSTVKGTRLDERNLRGAEGYVGLACDIVECDEKFRGIIDALLGKTAVVETIDDATELAEKNRHSFKIVTLDGQVVNPGGSLTGGSVGKNVGILSRANETERLAEESKKLTEDLKKRAEELKTATAETNAASAALDGLSAENKATEEEYIKICAETDHGKQMIKNIEDQIVSLEKSAENRKKLKERTLSDLNTAEQSLLVKREDLEKNITESEELAKKHAELAKIQEEITARLHEKELEKLGIEKNIENTENIIRSLDERLRSGKFVAERKRLEVEEARKRIAEYETDREKKNRELSELKAGAAERSDRITAENAKRTEAEMRKNKVNEEEKNLLDIRGKLGREIERSEIRQASLKNEESSVSTRIWDEYELTLTEAEQFAETTEKAEADYARRRVGELKNQIKALGSVNVDAIDEFTQVKERYDSLEHQINDLVSAKESLEKIISQLVSEMAGVFEEKFTQINDAFSKVFRDLFGGGTAKLTLTEPDNLLESGVDIFVAPPGKVIKHLSALSGGEQSLTAIALYFALLKVRPSPFCLLDEIESALDDVNVVRYAQYLSRLAESTQFLLITHRRGSMEASDRLYGVTMREKGISKILVINVDEIEKGYV